MRAVLIPIADAANRDGDHAHPGKEAIMEGSLYGRSAVTDAIRRLLTERWIEVEEWGRGRGQATVYRVLMGRPPSTPDPVLEPPKAPKCSPPERANSWPLSAKKPAAPGVAVSGRISGHSERGKRPMPSAKAAGAPTWNASPTVNLSTETLTTRLASGDATSELLLDLRAGIEDKPQNPQGRDLASELLVAVARAAPASARHQLLDDPEQAPGRTALRRRLVALASEVGFDAAVVVVAGEWPAAVASPMAHANARARARLEGHPVSTPPPAAAVPEQPSPAAVADVPPETPIPSADPLAGLAAARQALAKMFAEPIGDPS